ELLVGHRFSGVQDELGVLSRRIAEPVTVFDRVNDHSGDDIRLRRIADHIRAITFCIADGAVPGNEGRGYVVRKILRRACRDGYELGLEDPFLHGLSSVVVEHMGAVYPELVTAQKQVKALVHTEETGFRQIYTQGIERFRSWCGDLGGRKKWRTREVEEHGTLPVPPGSGEVAFELHDTYGFPVDITRQLLLDRGLALDQDAFDREMQVQRERARSSSALAGEVFVEGLVTRLKQRSVAETEFIGYGAIEGRGRVLALSRKDEELDQVAAGEQAEMLVDRTPFYAEAGGQVGDQGEIRVDTGRARVRDCRRREGYSFHRIEMLEGSLRVGQEAELLVSPEHRAETERNHTATHLLHRALKDVLGDHVSQAGSLVAADRLRFDFTHAERLSREQIGEIERIVSREIMRATPVSPREMSLEDARSAGFIAMFGEKYADVVRTVSVGDFSRELCGGTHVANTGNIGFFRIVSESSIAAGVRRIEAVTGFGALAHWQDETRSFDELARLLRSPRSEIPARIDGLQKEIRRLRKELEAAKRSQSSGALADLELEIREKDGVSLLATHVADASQDDLLELCDRLRKKYVCLACLLIGSSGKAVPVVAAVTKDVVGTGRHAGNLVRSVARTLGGGGGGRPEMARGSGTDASKIPEALESAWEALLA
ncbi:MAG: alanine--tRNA ligase, partial [Planctomycetota bacterium]